MSYAEMKRLPSEDRLNLQNDVVGLVVIVVAVVPKSRTKLGKIMITLINVRNFEYF